MHNESGENSNSNNGNSNHNFRSLIGRTFHWLLVIERGENGKGGKVYWNCLCECGNRTKVRTDHLKAGKIKSCGCKVAFLVSATERKEGNALSIYNGVKERLFCESLPSHEHYKEAGVRMCSRWLSGFAAFHADIGNKPEGLSIDRINPFWHYSCGSVECFDCLTNGWTANCRWANAKQQANNRREHFRLFHGKLRRTLPAGEWAVFYGFLTRPEKRIFYRAITDGKYPELTPSDAPES